MLPLMATSNHANLLNKGKSLNAGARLELNLLNWKGKENQKFIYINKVV